MNKKVDGRRLRKGQNCGKPPINEEKFPDNKFLGETIVKCYGRLRMVARMLNMEISTVYQRIRKHPELKQAVVESRKFIVEVAELKLMANVNSGDQRAIEFVLKNKGQGWTKDDAEDKVADLGTVISMFQKALEETKPKSLPTSGTIIDVGLHADPKPQSD